MGLGWPNKHKVSLETNMSSDVSIYWIKMFNLLASILFSPFVQFGCFLSINYFPCGVLTPAQLA